jgi:hypothetical protein
MSRRRPLATLSLSYLAEAGAEVGEARHGSVREPSHDNDVHEECHLDRLHADANDVGRRLQLCAGRWGTKRNVTPNSDSIAFSNERRSLLASLQ